MKNHLFRAKSLFRRSCQVLRYLLSATFLLWLPLSSASNTLSVGCYGPYKLEMDANRTIEISTNHIMYEIFDPLVFIHASGKPLPGSARTWELSADGRTYRFSLDPNARWSDGEPVIAQNFVDGWTRCMRWEQDCIQELYTGIENSDKDTKEGSLNPVSGLLAEAPHTLVVKMQRPFAIDLTTFNSIKFAPFPSHLHIPFDQAWSSNAQFISNGPLRIESATEDRVEFVKNEHYKGPYPASVDKLTYIADPSGKTPLPKYIRGDIQGICNVDSNQDQWLSEHLPDHIVTVGTSRSSFLSLNLNHPDLKKIPVRLGMYLAVEEHREQLLKQINIHNAQPLRGIVPENYLSYHSVIASYNDLLERHPKALASLNGIKLSLVLSDRPTEHVIGRFLQRAWHKYGLELDVRYSQLSMLEQADMMAKEEVDLMYATWYPDYASPRSFLALMDSAAPYASFFQDEEYRHKLQYANNKLSSEERFIDYAHAEAFMINEKMPIIGLYSQNPYLLLKPELQRSNILSSFPSVLRFGSLKLKQGP